MYYRLWDSQVGRYMATGYNTKSRKELREHLLSYLSNDFDETSEDWAIWKKANLNELVDVWEFQIEKSKTKFEEQDW